MYLFTFCPNIGPGVGLLDHMATLFLAFWGTSLVTFWLRSPKIWSLTSTGDSSEGPSQPWISHGIRWGLLHTASLLHSNRAVTFFPKAAPWKCCFQELLPGSSFWTPTAQVRGNLTRTHPRHNHFPLCCSFLQLPFIYWRYHPINLS